MAYIRIVYWALVVLLPCNNFKLSNVGITDGKKVRMSREDKERKHARVELPDDQLIPIISHFHVSCPFNFFGYRECDTTRILMERIARIWVLETYFR
jgi:hypothetical protein